MLGNTALDKSNINVIAQAAKQPRPANINDIAIGTKVFFNFLLRDIGAIFNNKF